MSLADHPSRPALGRLAGRALKRLGGWTALACAFLFAQLPPAVAGHSAGTFTASYPSQLDAEDLIVQFKESATENELADALAQAELEPRRHVHTRAMKDYSNPGFLRAGTRLPLEQALRKLKGHAAVAFAEPNWIVTHQTVANDPYVTSGSLWGMYGDASAPANGFGCQAAEAWNAGYTGSHDVCVGIIDEGIQFNHRDLAANIWTNPFDLADGYDNDGNGYRDDVHGWNFAAETGAIYNAATDDHGTHVAGTIGAIGGNGAGVAGVNWHVTLIAGKFLRANGGTVADAVQAIDYFVDLKRRHGLNLVALNNSWAGGGYSQALHDAIIRAAKADILFVAAAGNGDANGNGINTDLTPNYPSCYDTTRGTTTQSPASFNAVIAVAAIDRYGHKARFSNYGARTVHLGAPGVGIYSTLPNNSYGAYSGTSMAAPHVTGAAALYASTHPGAAALQIRNALLSSVIPTPSLAGITATGGRLNLSAIIGPTPAVSIVPATPTSLSASALSSSQIQLNWADNSTDEFGFKVEVSSLGSGFIEIGTLGANSTSCTVDGCVSKTAYSFRVRACNAEGNSAYSNTAAATTY